MFVYLVGVVSYCQCSLEIVCKNWENILNIAAEMEMEHGDCPKRHNTLNALERRPLATAILCHPKGEMQPCQKENYAPL
uniref:Uncharacterized protein n=1 Tax=Romanomermis culicivorax TaxID=13658 RepID=A0A915KIH1_ROMCU